jgi:hypothetical protein
MSPRSLCILCSLVFILCPQAYCTELNLAPLFYYTSGEQGYTCNIIGPILEFSSDHTAVRPLFYKEASSMDILYPLGYRKPGSSVFTPLYRSEEDDGNSHTDIFPIFWGRYEDKRYGGFFPLYGTLYHRYGKDVVHFFLWPLYSSSTTGDSKTYSVLWPIFTYSPGREYKVFPLYGREQSMEGTYQYALWPIFHRKRGAQDMDAMLPLFLYARGEQNRTVSVLWPFFTYNRDDAAGFMSMDMPWPLIRTASGAYEETRIFPLYWSKTEGRTKDMKTILWPVYSARTIMEPDLGYYEHTTRILILSSFQREVKDGQTTSTLHLWPLFSSYEDANEKRWRFPNLIPISDAGFRRNWEPLLTVISDEKTLALSQLDILWHTLYYRSEKGRSRLAFSFLVSYESGVDFYQVGFLSDLLRITWRKNKPKLAE